MSPSLFRALRERRATLGWMGNVVVAVAFPFCCFAALPRKAHHFGMSGGAGSTRRPVPDVFLERFPHHKLPLAYLRESLLVLHLQLLFQGGVKFPTGGKSDGAKGVPWRR